MSDLNMATPTPHVLWLDSPDFERRIGALNLSPAEETAIRQFQENGYLIFDFDDAEGLLDRVVEEAKGRYMDAPSGYRAENRILDAWEFSPAVRALAASKQVLALLERLYRRRPIPFQTLNFERGTQQEAHSDLIHFNCFPRNFMCGVWIALEATDADNGPLFYLKGSHRLPFYDYFDFGIPRRTPDTYRLYEQRIAAVAEAARLEKECLHLRKGQGVVWAANLLHGGSPILNKERTRLSQVTHYYFDNCYYYQPGFSEPEYGRFHLKDLRDIATGERIANQIAGSKVHTRKFGYSAIGGTALGRRIDLLRGRSLTEIASRVKRKLLR